jgi:hypothetical protein
MPGIGLFSWPKSAIPKCAAKTRKGTPCERRGVGKGGRCRNHGGMSTGPKTARTSGDGHDLRRRKPA